MKNGKQKRLISFFVAVAIMVGLITVPVKEAAATENEQIIFQEAFTGDNKAVQASEGWVLNPNSLAGYNTSGNFGEASPSVKLDGTGKFVESPSFSLQEEGTLSFWAKGQSIKDSKLDVKVFIDNTWTVIKTLNAEEGTLPNDKGDIVTVTIPKEATKLRLEYIKVTSNVAIDDIKLVGIVNGETEPEQPPVDPPVESKAHMVISEVYGGGGNSGATLKNDFIEIYNPTDTEVDLTGWKVEYAAKTGSFSPDNSTELKGKIAPGGYFLVQQAKGNAGTEDLVEPDAIGNIAMGASDGKVRLVNDSSEVIDFVGFGAANEAEGTAITGLSATKSAQRKDNDGSDIGETNGWDTDDNSKDFYTAEPTPRNSQYSSVPVELEGLNIEDILNLEVGQQHKIVVEYIPINTTQKAVKFEGDNSEIVTVDEKTGNITALKEGTAVVKVTSTVNSDISKSCTINVTMPEDKVGPEVKEMNPKPGASTGENKKPEISATFEDPSGVNMDSIKMWVDEIEVTSKLVKTENTVKFAVEKELEEGKHTVKVEVKDSKDNSTSKEWTFTVGVQDKNLYFGQLHSHTNLSDGQGSIDEAYTYARDNANLDFFAVTDHSNWFDNDTKGNIADGSASTTWKTGQSAADKYNKDGEFTAIYGYEMTWSGSTGGYGHMNTFNTPGFETRSNKNMNLQNYYNTLKTQEQSISQFNHPGKTFGDFSDFGLYDGASDDAISLLEVGNGEGPVRGSGYFPSYEYYTRALDKGWHLAPTNNQDNHKGLWGNSNTAKTVVEASELTRESLYDALENRRVYSTEDENLRVSYEVNGQTMGSILPETDSLAFNINVEDIDSGDNIKKISIIGDAGRVIKSIDNINSTSKNWTFTLDSSESSYYYVKVEQADKDIAVTSAIWVGEKENVGISTVDCDSEVITVGDEFKILTTIYNNEAMAINNIRIEYYLNDNVDPIKTEIIDKVDAAKTVVAELPYTVDKAGEYTFTVKVTATVNGADKEFVGKKTVEVVNASEISKVVIDGAHQNQYVTGDYAGKITTLTALMAQNNIKGIINEKPITDEVLEGASLLILSDPQSISKPDYNLEPHKYSQEELAAIARYVEKGGNIAITSKADYGDAIGEYGNAAQGNSVLEAIGAKLRFNDDQATDDSENGGQSYRLYFDDYNENSKWLEGIDLSKKYSFYSGSTLVMPNNLENVDVLVKGHPTTYGNDADNQKDNVPVEKGDVVGLAVETLSNGSKIIVSGATFFSNFEMDGLDYSNYQITEKVLKELAAAPELPVSNIADVRVDKDEDNNPDRFGETVVVEGYVTAASNLGAPGNSFFDVIYVQDGTAGLTVFGVSTTNVKLGQKVRIKGRVSSYLGDTQIALKNEDTGLQIIDENINLVEPTKLSTKDSMLEEKEGLLVKVEGTVTRIEGQNIYVNDGSGESRVYTEGYIGSSTNPGVADEWKTRVKVGDSISAIGLASEDPEGHRLRVRDSAEIVVTEVSKENVEINILHTNDSHGRVKGDSKVIGIDTIAAIKNSLENSLLVDAGDTLHGLPFATMNRGSDIVELMKMAGYDLMAPGNHDFNYGYERLLELADQAKADNGFDIISANVLKDGKSILDSNNIKEINGVKVGFFGLTSPETTYKTNPNNVKGLEFADPIKTAEAQVKALKDAGADVVIALAHIGTDKSTEITSEDIAKEVKGIDVIIDGHSHSKFENGFEAANETLIVSSGEYEGNLGKLTLTVDIDTKKLVTKTATLINKAEASEVTPDAEVSGKIAKIDAEQSVVLSEVIGTNITELDGVREHVRAGETNLGNLITDSMLYTTGAEIAITNGGGIRASINVGEITKGEVIEVLPFGNFIVTKYLTGKQIKDVLEHGVKDAPELAGQFPHVAGINFVYDVNQPVGSKIVKITVNGEKIDMDKQYLVATNDFIAASGDGYPHFGEVKTENEFSALDEALASYVKELKAVDYKLEGRITVGTAEEVEDTENKVIADKVIEQITELPEIAKLTLSDKEKVIAARAAYNALTDDQKALVPQEILDMLVAAEAKIAELEKEEEKPEEKPEIPVNPEKPGDGNGSGSGNNNNNNNQGSDGGKGDLPQTGGNNSMYFLIFGLLMIGTGAIVVFKKKSKIKEAK